MLILMATDDGSRAVASMLNGLAENEEEAQGTSVFWLVLF